MSRITVEEGAELMSYALLTAYADEDDDFEVPLRMIVAGLSERIGHPLTKKDIGEVVEFMPLGELRASLRMVLADLARGEKL